MQIEVTNKAGVSVCRINVRGPNDVALEIGIYERLDSVALVNLTRKLQAVCFLVGADESMKPAPIAALCGHETIPTPTAPA